MKSKGQAFSVFNLLIAAIVAFAILYILLTIIPTPDLFANPNEVAQQLLPIALQNPGSVETAGMEARFDELTNMAPSAIIAQSGITAENICILKHDFKDDDAFVFKRTSLYYEGTSPRNLRISAVCARPSDLQAILNEELDDPAVIAPGASDDVACGTGCDPVGNANQTCCAIMLNHRG